ncbi:MAG TPA: MerR family DNA-binding protein [Terriglobia bacterium]|nr:MerR family DNA-binding protein [Terriglobia bacterium]
MNALTIGKIAKGAGVGVETLRFYEREGLIKEPPRRDSGYREYPADTVDRVRFIRRAQALGFSLREIKDLMALRIERGGTCAQVKRRAETKIVDIEERIRSLQRINRVLQKLVSACGSSGLGSECPLLDALEDGRQ